MTIKLSMPKPEVDLQPRITVVGVGGAGGNAVNNMIQANLEGVDFVVANTDAQALMQSQADCKIQLGGSITQGLGSGSRPEIGRAAAEETLDDILDHLAGSHMVFVTGGMGGGTGTGAAPVIARSVREHGILTVGVVTKPFHFEGSQRMKTAESGVDELQQYVDTLIIIPNQNLFRVANEKTTFAEAFKMADNVLYSGVRGVTDLMVMPGLINLDFADVRTVMSEMGKAMMGTGEAEGESRAIAAAEAAISNPLLDDITMKGARGVLINITGGTDMTLFEVDEAANRIREEVDNEASIVFGSTFDETMEGLLRVSVVATGIEVEAMTAPRPIPSGLSTLTPRPERDAPVVSGQKTDEAFAAEELVASDSVIEMAKATAIPAETAVLEVPGAEVENEEMEVLLLDEIKTELRSGELDEITQVVPKSIATENLKMMVPKPAAAERPSETDDGLESVKLEPRLTQTQRGPFIPPKPVVAERASGDVEPEPFAAAAMENAHNASQKSRLERHRPSLFERMTGAAKPTYNDKPEDTTSGEVATSAPATNTQAVSQEPEERFQLSQAEEEMLDIPAFLRRQAN
ncbi:MAG: cell division protein FtsZ [Pseudomonadota bacterium]|nr:cell division protein FtsZ [Pseudomonadota bacterium]